MKKQIKIYSALLTLTLAVSIAVAFQRSAGAANKADAPQDLRNEKAIEYLKQTDSYDSLSKALENARPAAVDSIFIQSQKLTVFDGADGDQFGSSVAISGDTAVVGALFDDVNGNQSQGSAYIFIFNGANWTLQTKIVAGDGATSDRFGEHVAISGDTVIVGANGQNSGGNYLQGAAYIFTRFGTNWTQQAKLIASDGEIEDYFGSSVSIFSDTVIVGANKDDVGANSQQGSAYVFVRNGSNWTFQQKLTAADGAAGSFFGDSVALAGGTAIIGAQGLDSNRGAAYIFTRSGSVWTQQAKLVADDGASGDNFGASVDLTNTLSGAIAVVGAIFDDEAGNSDQGSAYIFTRSQIGTWSQTQKLLAADGVSNAWFGHSVSIASTTGSTLIVGAFLDSPGSNSSQGSAYIFKRNGSVWTQRPKLTARDGVSGDKFGSSVAISGETAIIGASGDDVGADADQGSAYIFNVGGSPFDFDGDGKTDISIFRPSNGQWWYYRSSDGGSYAATFGSSTDKLTPGDFTGDGKTDIALFRPVSGEWFILRSEDGSYYSFPFGTNGDTPAVGDFDADGKADAAVFRPSTATWYIRRSTDGGTTIQQFGNSGDIPAVADYDGDGKADIAIFRPSNGQWWINRSTLGVIAFTFGTGTDKPAQGDYTGDGKADVAFWRPSTGEWFILRSEDGSFYSFPFGANGDTPAPGDYDGDGKFDATVFRPSNSTWFVNKSTGGNLIQSFGQTGDRPVPNAFIN